MTARVNPAFALDVSVENFGFQKGETTYKLKQIDPLYSPLPPTAKDGLDARIDIPVFAYGPLSVVGFVDTTTFELGVQLEILGIKLAELYGNLKDGIKADIDLKAVSGFVRFYLENGNEVWIELDLKVIFDGHYQKKAKIFSF